jgi:hypothetical protein
MEAQKTRKFAGDGSTFIDFNEIAAAEFQLDQVMHREVCVVTLSGGSQHKVTSPNLLEKIRNLLEAQVSGGGTPQSFPEEPPDKH